MKYLLAGVLAIFILQFCTNNLEEVTGLTEDHIYFDENIDFSIPSEAFLGQYFTSKDLVTPISSRIESRIRHDFNSPIKQSVLNQELSARWTGEFHFKKGAYTFNIHSDKGIKVIVNKKVLLDEDGNGEEKSYEITKEIEEGEQIVEVEYNLDESNADPVGTSPTEPADTTSTDPIGTSPTEPADTASTDPVGTSPTDPADTTQTGPVDETPTDPVVETDNDTPTVEVDWSPSSPEPGNATDTLMHPSMTLQPMGWAASTVGGTGGRIIKVTNLNANGPGSFKEALDASGPRIIVFEVGGIINMNGAIWLIRNPNVTIMGQTAPSPGITLIRGGLSVRANDVIIQHLRVRPGENDQAKLSGWEVDGLGVYIANNVIIDHCSFSWATDECLSAAGPYFDGSNVNEWRDNTSHTITFSNNIIAETLFNSTHRKGGHSRGGFIGDNVTKTAIVRNIYASNNRRNPLFKGGAQGVVVNNYIYNPGEQALRYILVESEWSGRTIITGKLTVIGNVAEKGPDTPSSTHFAAAGRPCDIYWEDNYTIGPSFSAPDVSGDFNIVTTRPVWHDNIIVLPSGPSLKDELLENSGARPWDRDEVDRRIIQGIIDGTNKMIDSEQEVGGYPAIQSTYREFDPAKWGL
jgi:hypothetical protein